MTRPPKTWHAAGTSQAIGQLRQSRCSRAASNSVVDLTSLTGKRNFLAFSVRDLDSLKSRTRFTKPARLAPSRTSNTDSSLQLTDITVIESGLVRASSSGVKGAASSSRPSTSARAVPLVASKVQGRKYWVTSAVDLSNVEPSARIDKTALRTER